MSDTPLSNNAAELSDPIAQYVESCNLERMLSARIVEVCDQAMKNHRLEQRIEQLECELNDLRDKADLYEVVRRMNPKQFSDAWKLNTSWGKPFDEIIRDLKPFYLKGTGK